MLLKEEKRDYNNYFKKKINNYLASALYVYYILIKKFIELNQYFL